MLPFTLQQLRIFKAIANEKSFTKASDILYLSQPSLSKQIKTLEQNLNISLINRENNKISLTENGKIFLEYSERILCLCEESCRVLIDLKNVNRGKLRIGVTQTIDTYLMAQILILFRENYPQIYVKVQVNLTPNIIKAIINNEIDIGIVGGSIPKQLKKKIIVEHFAKDELHLIISKSHPFAKKKTISVDELYDLNFITFSSNLKIRRFVDNLLKQNSIETKELKIIMELNSIEEIKIGVTLGLGSAFIPYLAIQKELQFGKIISIKIENIKIIRSLAIISNPKYSKSKPFELFYNELSSIKNNSLFTDIT
jgi:DNA-binding transcriptional LysR family regulator